jgi:hypothetical protein
MRAIRISSALVVAGLAALILQTHVFVAFRPIRAKMVQAPVAATAGEVRVGTAGVRAVEELRPPFALIARIRSSTGEAGLFSITVDGAPVCERRVAAGAARRIDCTVTTGWNPAAGHEVAIRGPGARWTLEYLELATHHGNSTGALTLWVLPWNSTDYVRPAAVWTLAFWMVVAAILALPSPRLVSRRVRLCYRAFAGAAILLLAVSLCSQWLSAYRVVLAPGTFLTLLAVPLAPRLWLAGWWLVRRQAESENRWVAVARAGLVGALVLVVYFGVVNARLRDSYGGNYSGLLLISRSAFDTHPSLKTRDDIRRTLVLQDNGYDGQFMYFATFDPFLLEYEDAPSTYRQVMDSAPYRYGRIGFSLLTRVFSGGRWQWYPATMVWLILGSLSLAAFAVARLAQGRGETAALGGLVLLVPGFWPSLQSGLPEPIASAALVGGILCLARARWMLAAAMFAVSLLVRETGIVAVACVAGAGMFSGGRRQAVFVGAFAVSVMALWRLYVAWVLFPDWGTAALLSHPPDLGWPFAGIVDLWRVIAQGGYYPGTPEIARAGIVFPSLLALGFLLSVALAIRAPSTTSVAALVYAIIGISLNFPAIWVHVGNGQRGTFELFVMLALSLTEARTYSRPVRAGLFGFWSASAAYVFFLAFDAQYIRSAIGLPF